MHLIQFLDFSAIICVVWGVIYSSTYLFICVGLIFLCVECFAIFVYICVYHMHTRYPWRSEEVFDPHELELQMVLSLHLNFGNWTRNFKNK